MNDAAASTWAKVVDSNTRYLPYLRFLIGILSKKLEFLSSKNKSQDNEVKNRLESFAVYNVYASSTLVEFVCTQGKFVDIYRKYHRNKFCNQSQESQLWHNHELQLHHLCWKLHNIGECALDALRTRLSFRLVNCFYFCDEYFYWFFLYAFQPVSCNGSRDPSHVHNAVTSAPRRTSFEFTSIPRVSATRHSTGTIQRGWLTRSTTCTCRYARRTSWWRRFERRWRKLRRLQRRQSEIDDEFILILNSNDELF